MLPRLNIEAVHHIKVGNHRITFKLYSDVLLA